MADTETLTLRWRTAAGRIFLVQEGGDGSAKGQVFATLTPPDPKEAAAYPQMADAWGWRLANEPYEIALERRLAVSGVVLEGGVKAAADAVHRALAAVYAEADGEGTTTESGVPAEAGPADRQDTGASAPEAEEGDADAGANHDAQIAAMSDDALLRDIEIGDSIAADLPPEGEAYVRDLKAEYARRHPSGDVEGR